MTRDPHAHHHAHLGERISPLVDAELDHDARDRALAHAAECPDCLAALDAERRLKSLLATAPAPSLPDSLTARLLAIADPGEPVPPRERAFPGAAQPLAAAPRGATRPLAGRPSGRGDASRPGGRRRLGVPARAVTVVPDGVPACRAVLGGTVETAVNALWDAAPLVGDRVAVDQFHH